MERRVSKVVWSTVGVLAISTSLVVGPAEAAPVPIKCGTVITQNTTLTANVGPCKQGGLVIGASGITLDLAGFQVFGQSRTNDGSGIKFANVDSSVVRNGTVRAFDVGVAIEGGSLNTVTDLVATNNVGDFKGGKGTAGAGITILGSDSNHITQNQVLHNGPFAGIEILGTRADPASTPSDGNVIDYNDVLNNDVASGAVGPNQDYGIRIEGPAATNTYLGYNTIIGSGLDGIGVFADQLTGFKNTGTVIEYNTIEGNGFHPFTHRKGGGINLFGLHTNPAVGGADVTTVRLNDVHNNAADGIRVASDDNVIHDNDAIGNNVIGNASFFDLNDTHADCDNNIWLANAFGTASRTCIS